MYVLSCSLKSVLRPCTFLLTLGPSSQISVLPWASLRCSAPCPNLLWPRANCSAWRSYGKSGDSSDVVRLSCKEPLSENPLLCSSCRGSPWAWGYQRGGSRCRGAGSTTTESKVFFNDRRVSIIGLSSYELSYSRRSDRQPSLKPPLQMLCFSTSSKKRGSRQLGSRKSNRQFLASCRSQEKYQSLWLSWLPSL